MLVRDEDMVLAESVTIDDVTFEFFAGAIHGLIRVSDPDVGEVISTSFGDLRPIAIAYVALTDKAKAMAGM